MATPHSEDALGKIAVALDGKTHMIESATDRMFSWRQHIEDRNRFCSVLSTRGVKEGDRIVCYGHNSYEWVLTRTAANMMRCFFVPLNWHLAAPEVAYIVDNCDACVITVDAAFVSTLKAAQAAEPLLFSKMKYYMVWGGDGHGDGIGESFHAALGSGDSSFPQNAPASRSMGYTGGTSGKPKAVVNGNRETSPEEQKRGAQNFALTMGPEGLNLVCPQMIQIVAAPLYHAAPGGFLVIALNTAMTLVLMQKFDAREFVSQVSKHKVTNSIMPPILVKRITDLPMEYIRSYDLSSLTSIISVGAPCPMPVKDAALKVGLPLHEFYGSSELGINTVLQPRDMLRKPGSCGRIAPGVTMKIIGEDGKECPHGTQGLLYIQCHLDYYNAEQKTKDATLASDPTFKTVGDVAYIDEENFVYICDRKIDMIISGGANIYPAEIEDCLFGHPDIADAAVFGVPDPDYGERVHAAVLLKQGRNPSVDDIQAFCRSRIAGFKVPRELSFPTDFPRTPSGKILKRQLRDAWHQKSKL